MSLKFRDLSNEEKFARCIQWTTITVLWTFTLNILTLGALTSLQPTLGKLRFEHPEKMLVLAAHNDDEIIQAGGMLIRNTVLGGSSHVVVLTREPDDEIAQERTRESNAALELIYTSAPGELPHTRPVLTSLNFISQLEWDDQKIAAAKDAIRTIVADTKPTLVVLPLREDGHYEHDLLSDIGTEVMKAHPEIRVFYSAEYNPVYRVKEAPGKVLWFMIRLLPWIPYHEPTYGLNRQAQLRLEMTPEEVEFKKRLLQSYTSQLGVVPETQFGYPDLIENPQPMKTPPMILVREKLFSPWALASIGLMLLLAACIGASTGMVLTNVWTQFGSLALITALFAFISRCSPEAILNDWLIIISASLGLVFTLSVRLLLTVSNRQHAISDAGPETAEPTPLSPTAAPPPSSAPVRSYLAVSESFEAQDRQASGRKVVPKEMLPPAVKPKTEIAH